MNATASAPRVLNYDPTDPDKMRLPKGVTCGDCVHIRRCSAIYGHTATDTYCDWSPSRLQLKPAAPAAEAKTCLGCGARHPINPDGTPVGGAIPCGH